MSLLQILQIEKAVHNAGSSLSLHVTTLDHVKRLEENLMSLGVLRKLHPMHLELDLNLAPWLLSGRLNWFKILTTCSQNIILDWLDLKHLRLCRRYLLQIHHQQPHHLHLRCYHLLSLQVNQVQCRHLSLVVFHPQSRAQCRHLNQVARHHLNQVFTPHLYLWLNVDLRMSIKWI